MNKFGSAFESILGLGAILVMLGPAPSAARTADARNAGQPAPAARADAAGGDEAQTLYALGVLISRNLEDFQLTQEEFERVRAGLIDGFNHRAKQVDLTVDTPKVQALRHTRMARLIDKRIQDGQAYVSNAAALPGAKKTSSGLVMVPIKPGKGATPTKEDTVLVRYQGKLIDGSVFDASKDEPAKFELTAVIPCWAEAVPLMKIGEKSRIICPPNLAYGLHGAPPKIASQSTLDFEVELIGIAPASAETPPSAQAPPSARAAPPAAVPPEVPSAQAPSAYASVATVHARQIPAP
jgi:FKBP-type peptidyl-prolyl cis-trans isomerase